MVKPKTKRLIGGVLSFAVIFGLIFGVPSLYDVWKPRQPKPKKVFMNDISKLPKYENVFDGGDKIVSVTYPSDASCKLGVRHYKIRKQHFSNPSEEYHLNGSSLHESPFKWHPGLKPGKEEISIPDSVFFITGAETTYLSDNKTLLEKKDSTSYNLECNLVRVLNSKRFDKVSGGGVRIIMVPYGLEGKIEKQVPEPVISEPCYEIDLIYSNNPNRIHIANTSYPLRSGDKFWIFGNKILNHLPKVGQRLGDIESIGELEMISSRSLSLTH